MTVRELVETEHFRAAALPDPERVISGVYIGDLLSWVMGRASSGDVWITIMSNINILAVATLADTACILVAENVELDETLIATANEKGINIILCDYGIYQAAVALNSLL